MPQKVLKVSSFGMWREWQNEYFNDGKMAALEAYGRRWFRAVTSVRQ